MAFLDSLSQPVGGYEDSSNLEGISEYTRGAPKSSMTWGQFIGAISNLAGQSSQGNNLTSNPLAQFNQGAINQGFNQSNVPFSQSSLSPFGLPDSSQDSQDMGEIMQLLSLFSGSLGAEGGILGPTTSSTGTGLFAV